MPVMPGQYPPPAPTKIPNDSDGHPDAAQEEAAPFIVCDFSIKTDVPEPE